MSLQDVHQTLGVKSKEIDGKLYTGSKDSAENAYINLINGLNLIGLSMDGSFEDLKLKELADKATKIRAEAEGDGLKELEQVVLPLLLKLVKTLDAEKFVKVLKGVYNSPNMSVEGGPMHLDSQFMQSPLLPLKVLWFYVEINFSDFLAEAAQNNPAVGKVTAAFVKKKETESSN